MSPGPPAVKADMSSTAPCPSLEDLGAYREAKLSKARRRQIEQHLVACADCREQLVWASSSLDELEAAGGEVDGVLRPFDRATGRDGTLPFGSRRRGLVYVTGLATAAILAAAIALPMLLRGRPGEGMSSPQLAAQIGPAGMGVVAAGEESVFPWGHVFRGLGDGNSPLTVAPALESFQLGVREVDLRLALAAGPVRACGNAYARLSSLLAHMELLSDQTKDGYQDLGKALNDDGVSTKSLLPRAEALESHGFADVVDPEFVAFGRWTEACRLHGAVGSGPLFDSRATRRLLDWLVEPQKDAETTAGAAGTPPPANAALLNTEGVPDEVRALRDAVQQLASRGGAAPATTPTIADRCKRLLTLLDPD